MSHPASCGCLKSETQYLRFPSTYLVDHDPAPWPVDAAIQGCAVHMAANALALGRHRDCLRAVNVFITPPTSHALAHGAFGTLEALPTPVRTISQDLKDFTEGELPRSGSASHSKCSFFFTPVRTTPPQRFRLGLHVQVQQLLNDVIHHAHQSLCRHRVASNCQPTSCPRITYSLSCCPPKGNPQPLAFHFSSALHGTYLATRPHSTGASTPPWRIHLEKLNSVSLFS